MNGRMVCAAGLVLAGLMTTPAAAQEKGKMGLTVSAPSAIGLIWHLSERVAIRPEVSFSFNESEAESSSLPDIRSHSVSLAGSALFYTGHWDNLRTYVSPRFTYSWSSTSIDEAAPEFDSTQNAWGLSGSIGAQYNLGTRFAVFAEAGLMYSSTESETPTSIGDRTGWSFGSRTAIGGILYF
jgi:hypothetical protein